MNAKVVGLYENLSWARESEKTKRPLSHLDDDCPSSPDGFYEKEPLTNLWVPFIPPDQFRPYLECQSKPVTSGTDISTIYQNPADSSFAEGTCRDLLNHCDNSTSHFLVNSGVSNNI